MHDFQSTSKQKAVWSPVGHDTCVQPLSYLRVGIISYLFFLYSKTMYSIYVYELGSKSLTEGTKLKKNFLKKF